MRAFQGMEWTLRDVATYATTLESYAASGTRLYGGLTQRHLDPERVQDTLFPGLTVLALGLAGLASAPPRFRAPALLASAAAVVFSLGPETALYRTLHENLVLVRGVRALSRFSLVPVLALSVLAGFALAGRWRLSLARARRLSRGVGQRAHPLRARAPDERGRALAGGKGGGGGRPAAGRARHGGDAGRRGPLPAAGERGLRLHAPALHAGHGAAGAAARRGGRAPAARGRCPARRGPHRHGLARGGALRRGADRGGPARGHGTGRDRREAGAHAVDGGGDRGRPGLTKGDVGGDLRAERGAVDRHAARGVLQRRKDLDGAARRRPASPTPRSR